MTVSVFSESLILEQQYIFWCSYWCVLVDKDFRYCGSFLSSYKNRIYYMKILICYDFGFIHFYVVCLLGSLVHDVLYIRRYTEVIKNGCLKGKDVLFDQNDNNCRIFYCVLRRGRC